MISIGWIQLSSWVSFRAPPAASAAAIIPFKRHKQRNFYNYSALEPNIWNGFPRQFQFEANKVQDFFFHTPSHTPPPNGSVFRYFFCIILICWHFNLTFTAMCQRSGLEKCVPKHANGETSKPHQTRMGKKKRSSRPNDTSNAQASGHDFMWMDLVNGRKKKTGEKSLAPLMKANDFKMAKLQYQPNALNNTERKPNI